ncbi:WD repeat-containing protein on Y chromosome-like [Colletes gigas]|uniref:WD repeat-containing protein on Y chromosome-like n=1 Tax=Colletes gigas TaxID=935657 RepID=UPI001C9A7915|nr:WD repeat-containing protein on Y chromosome-like [Colletes gigas]
MENIEIIDEVDPLLYEFNESDSTNTENEVSSTFLCGESLKPPILGSSYRVPDIPKKCIEPMILDTSLPYIPVYTHLKIYDLKPVERPNTPPTLSELRLKILDDNESCLSSKASPLTGRNSKQRSSITAKSRESERVLKTE